MEIADGTYSRNLTYRCGTVPEVIKSIKRLENLPQAIISKALEIANEKLAKSEYKIYKGPNKDELICYCVLMAYIQLRYPIDPDYLLLKLGMTSNCMTRALYKNLDEGGTFRIAPMTMLEFYLNRLKEVKRLQIDSESIRKDFVSITKDISNTPAGVEYYENTETKKVTVGTLYFILKDMYTISITPAEAEEIFCDTHQRILDSCRKISQLYNSIN